MNSLFGYFTTRKPSPQADPHPLIQLHEPEHNTAEGGEFLFDALRMEDLPIIYTEESVAAGSPRNLL